MSEKFEWDIKCADRELGRLEAGFTTYDHLNFARVLMMGFARAQADVHVETGRLRSSGRASIDTAGAQRWSGEISFGGGAVRWAASEFFGYSPAHGGYPSHAYFKRLGWQPEPRFGVLGEDVPWTQSPVRDVAGGGVGVPIQDDMAGPVSSFISRGRRTAHEPGCRP